MNARKHSALSHFLLSAFALTFAFAASAFADPTQVAAPSPSPAATSHPGYSHLRRGTELSTPHAFANPACPQCGHGCQGVEPHAGQHSCDNCHYW
jgi:hypothetical protein